MNMVSSIEASAFVLGTRTPYLELYTSNFDLCTLSFVLRTFLVPGLNPFQLAVHPWLLCKAQSTKHKVQKTKYKEPSSYLTSLRLAPLRFSPRIGSCFEWIFSIRAEQALNSGIFEVGSSTGFVS